MDCAVPATAGAGSPKTWVAKAKLLPAVIGDVEYRRSYEVAVPTAPSSPGAVQVTVIEDTVVVVVSKSAMDAGA